MNARALKPGEVVCLARGSIWQEPLKITKSGSATAPITFQAYGAGAAPTIDLPFTNVNDSTPGVQVAASYVTVLDLRITNVHWSAITFENNTQYVTVAGNEIANSGYGLAIYGQHQRVLLNFVHDGTMVIDNGPPNGDGDFGAAGCGVQGKDIEIAWNRFVNCSAPSKSFGTDGGAVEFWGLADAAQGGWNYVTDNVRIHHNIADHTDGFMECTGTITNLLIADNLYVNSVPEAFEFHMDDAVNIHTYDVRIENNTLIVDPTLPAGGWGIVGMLVDYNNLPDLSANKIVFRNNIVSTHYKLAAFHNPLGVNFVHDHNLYRFLGSGSISWYPAEFPLAATEKIADPKFVDELGQDFRLAAGSPAIGAAAPTSYTTDLLGTAVPSGGAPDLGAYEYTGDTPFAQSQLAAGNQARLERLFAKGRAGQPVTLGVIGGSITEGVGASAAANRWANLVQAWWQQTFPTSACTLVNAGIGATCSDYGALRVQSDVLSKNPDLVIVEFAVNDTWSGVAGAPGYTFGETYEGLLRQVLNNASKPAVLLLFMSQCNFNIGYPGYRCGELWQAPIGAHYGLPMASFEDGIVPEIDARRLACADVSSDGTHPNDVGHAFAAQFIEQTLQTALNAFPSGATPFAIPATPAPLRTDAFEFTTLVDGATLVPAANSGWTMKAVAGEMGAGYECAAPGSSIEFDVRGDRLLFSFWFINDVKNASSNGSGVGQGQVSVTVDGGAAVVCDSWSDAGWGGSRKMVRLGATYPLATHRVKITLLATRNAGNKTAGNTFRILALGSGGAK